MESVVQPPNSSKSPEEKMNIYLKVTKTVAFKFSKSGTIRDLKKAFREKEGVAENFQELFYGGEYLKDDRKLVDCGVQENSTLNLVIQTSGLVKLSVRISSWQKTILVEAKNHDTVDNIKLMISEKERILPDRYTLLYKGNVFENGSTLSSLGIKDEATLHLVFNPREIATLSVKLPLGEIVKMEARIWYTVCDVKEIVGSKYGFSVRDHNIIYEGKQLDDSLTLASYNVNDESVLEIVPMKFQILVKLWSGKTITLDVCQEDTISCVKSKLIEKLGEGENIPKCEYYFEYSGKLLVDDQDLASLGVGKQSTLHAKVRLSSTCVCIKKLHEIKGADKLPGWTTISLLKKFIKMKMKIQDPVKEVLLAEGRALRDDETLAGCGLHKNTYLKIIF